MTISPQTTLNNVKMYVKQKLSHDFSGHDMAHIERVVRLAQKILNHQPQANAFIVLMSAYLHDVIDEKVTEDVDSAIIELKEYLRSLKLTSAEISAIFDIIENMSYRKNLSQKATLSLEGQIVQDADRLDAIGAIGIGRTFYYGGNKHNIMHDPNVPPRIKLDENNYKQTNTVINHFYEKLFLLKDMMNTDTAKQMAEQRHEILVKFVNQFEQEWLGID
ncbi:HD domain-containing protein [Gilliamella sp. B3482]|uniref:HD domain-containing protein n=1 Tax=Gilliamella sp. B3482 TaxID=2817991 RepID=UPI002269CFF5|nr:HD domain-containing protein [Gilliamella sp. B3482]MCX8580770.1 HD domain-containing protein [Gilliamella sp. B3482]